MLEALREQCATDEEFEAESRALDRMISEPALDRLSAMFQGPDVSGTRYELISVLGRGGMGVVYLARDTVLDREVALKIVERPAAERATRNEARILARLEHPGIVPVHDFGELPDGRLFYAMKRVRGDRLDRWVASGRDLDRAPWRVPARLRRGRVRARARRHPSRSEARERDGRRVRRGARARLGRRRSQMRDRRSARPQIVGTPDYMAPEQARGDATVDHRADVYALGAMLESIADATPPRWCDCAQGAVGGSRRALPERPGAGGRRQPLPRRPRGRGAPRDAWSIAWRASSGDTGCRSCWCSPIWRCAC